MIKTPKTPRQNITFCQRKRPLTVARIACADCDHFADLSCTCHEPSRAHHREPAVVNPAGTCDLATIGGARAEPAPEPDVDPCDLEVP